MWKAKKIFEASKITDQITVLVLTFKASTNKNSINQTVLIGNESTYKNVTKRFLST